MKMLASIVLVCLLAWSARAVEGIVTATHGTISKIDRASKTVVIRTADGTEHAFRWGKNATVHGAQATGEAAKDSWNGLKEGSEVVAHSTKRGTEDTIVEVDKVSGAGFAKTEGTIKKIDRRGKKLVIASVDGSEHTFQLTGHAAADGGKDVAEGTEKGTKIAVYSTEEAGKKVAHFFEKI